MTRRLTHTHFFASVDLSKSVLAIDRRVGSRRSNPATSGRWGDKATANDRRGRTSSPSRGIRGNPRFGGLATQSLALDLTEGQPLGHSEIQLQEESLGSLYYALLMKDAECGSNSSRLYQIVGTDEIKAKRDVNNADWTRTTWESVHYALTHVHRKGSGAVQRRDSSAGSVARTRANPA
jgi:hypothetical protein